MTVTPIDIRDWVGVNTDLGKRAESAYEVFEHMPITVKHYDANAGQKRVIFRALHETHFNVKASHVVMIAVVMGMTQESTCRSLNYGDQSSVGPWQQQSWWGSAAQRRDAATSTKAFLMGVPGCAGWAHYFSLSSVRQTSENLGFCIQTVQKSAYSYLYSQWYTEAMNSVTCFERAIS